MYSLNHVRIIWGQSGFARRFLFPENAGQKTRPLSLAGYLYDLTSS